jgi:hypothetical protein
LTGHRAKAIAQWLNEVTVRRSSRPELLNGCDGAGMPFASGTTNYILE